MRIVARQNLERLGVLDRRAGRHARPGAYETAYFEGYAEEDHRIEGQLMRAEQRARSESHRFFQDLDASGGGHAVPQS